MLLNEGEEPAERLIARSASSFSRVWMPTSLSPACKSRILHFYDMSLITNIRRDDAAVNGRQNHRSRLAD